MNVKTIRLVLFSIFFRVIAIQQNELALNSEIKFQKP